MYTFSTPNYFLPKSTTFPSKINQTSPLKVSEKCSRWRLWNLKGELKISKRQRRGQQILLLRVYRLQLLVQKKEMKKLKQKEKMQREGGRERKGKFPFSLCHFQIFLITRLLWDIHSCFSFSLPPPPRQTVTWSFLPLSPPLPLPV